MVDDKDPAKDHEKVEYGKRLRAAMKAAGNIGVPALAAALDISYTGAKKLFDGRATATCRNNAFVARFLGCDSDWLATGEGEMHSTRQWPFRRVTPAIWFHTPENMRNAAEALVMSEGRRLFEIAAKGTTAKLAEQEAWFKDIRAEYQRETQATGYVPPEEPNEAPPPAPSPPPPRASAAPRGGKVRGTGFDLGAKPQARSKKAKP
ncbi:hypothetical protein [Caldimonas sp. KR1-144]|uniref:hypothetical protein n=1 Tax=Caldimonas sp. KR1-144 TaxID=3400911 RepID=UPI003C2B79A3